MNKITAIPVSDERTEGAGDQNRADIIAAWSDAFGSPPPPHMSRCFLRKAVTYHAQCKEFGGLSKQTQKTLNSIASGKPVSAATTRKLRPGAHLVREWNGRTYQVAIVEEGYLFDGHTYGSLTAIARRITGTNWSGPRFSGVNGAGG